MGFPVVGDPLYGGANRAKSVSDTVLRKMIVHLERQFLHAWQLGFDHPDGNPMLFQAALPTELQEILSYLEEKYNYEPASLAIEACAGPVETAY
jgi:23S rRNA pseudouridine1911/1915/1917 synthase